MRPVRYTSAPTITCVLADGRPEQCLEDLTTRIGADLRAHFGGRATVNPDESGHSIEVRLRDPLLSDDPEGGTHLLTASIALRVRELTATGENVRLEVQPRIVAEISRFREGEPWQWAVVDYSDKLGTFMGEIEDVLTRFEAAPE